MNTTHTPAKPAAKKRSPRKRAYKPIVAITAELINRLIKKGPQTDAQIRAALPDLHTAALNTLARTGFIAETRNLAEKTSVFEATPKGREAVRLRRQWLAKQLETSFTNHASASHKAAEAMGQFALDLSIAQPRRTAYPSATYNGAELQRNPYRAPTVASA